MIPATGGVESHWDRSSLVKGAGPTKADPKAAWQGWYSASYSDYSPAPVVLFDGLASFRLISVQFERDWSRFR